jgi:hypothetical protein
MPTEFKSHCGHKVWADELEARIADVLDEILAARFLDEHKAKEQNRKDELLCVLVNGLTSLPDKRRYKFRRELFIHSLRCARIDRRVAAVLLSVGITGLNGHFLINHSGWIVTQADFINNPLNTKAARGQ